MIKAPGLPDSLVTARVQRVTCSSFATSCYWHFSTTQISMDDVLEGLNEAQCIAVTSTASVLQVLAPPGSGKTKTLTARLAYLIAHQQLRPWDIIVCTFTVKAAREMKDRIETIVGGKLAKKLKLGTFHSVCLRYLKAYGQHVGLAKDFGIADTSDGKAILKRIIKKHHLTSFEPGQALGRISTRKVKGPDTDQTGKVPKNPRQQEFDLLFNEYEATLAASNLLDYDDLLLRCCFLLRAHPECVSNVQAVLVDEFQDTNTIQYDLMGLFAQYQNKITIVGDPDQSIYGFRLAEIQNLSRMKDRWPNTLTLNLEENYRSSGAILNAAQKVIEQDESRPPKKLRATHSLGQPPILRKLPNAYGEAEWLVSEIVRTRCLSGKMLEFGDYAILLRSASLSRVIETALGNTGIPYRMVGGSRFYDRVEIKLLIDYLRVIHQPANNEVIERILNVPSRRIGESTVKKLQEEAQTKSTAIWDLILGITQDRGSSNTKISGPARKGLTSFVDIISSGQEKIQSGPDSQPPLVSLVNFVAEKISLETFLKSKYPEKEDFDNRWANVEEFMTLVKEVGKPDRLKELAQDDDLPPIEGLEQSSSSNQDVLSVFLNNISLTASPSQSGEKPSDKVHQVTVSTIHAAKGLEWPIVFIPACFNGIIPHSRADDDDEERRLLYVGMTRAQALLYLSYPVSNNQGDGTSASSFLSEPGVDKFFEIHGPSLPPKATEGLAKVLGRDIPTQKQLDEAKSNLERDEDDYWPLNGTKPRKERPSWNNDYSEAQSRSGSSTTPNTSYAGFSSVGHRYDALMDQAQRGERKTKPTKDTGDAKNGKRSREDDKETGLNSFFKRQEVSDTSSENKSFYRPHIPLQQPREDISNNAVSIASRDRPTTRYSKSMPSHRPQMIPSIQNPATRNAQVSSYNSGYVFLSSSPTRPGSRDSTVSSHKDAAGAETTQDRAAQDSFQPAKTFHTTTTSMFYPQRKTLGVRRSLQGWNAGGRPSLQSNGLTSQLGNNHMKRQ